MFEIIDVTTKNNLTNLCKEKNVLDGLHIYNIIANELQVKIA